jgi:D-alanyl-D-alanine dipeptidase
LSILILKKNFFEENFYNGLNRAYLRKDIAVKLSKAQGILKNAKPANSLVLDAVWPRSVSRAMYEKMKGTPFERYVANPDKGSMHNYAIAVDITTLDMGPSPFYNSHSKIYWHYCLKRIGIEISTVQQQNRALLKRVMIKAGFFPLLTRPWILIHSGRQAWLRSRRGSPAMAHPLSRAATPS